MVTKRTEKVLRALEDAFFDNFFDDFLKFQQKRTPFPDGKKTEEGVANFFYSAGYCLSHPIKMAKIAFTLIRETFNNYRQINAEIFYHGI